MQPLAAYSLFAGGELVEEDLQRATELVCGMYAYGKLSVRHIEIEKPVNMNRVSINPCLASRFFVFVVVDISNTKGKDERNAMRRCDVRVRFQNIASHTSPA